MNTDATRRAVVRDGLAASLTGLGAARARAANAEPLRVGVLSDQSGAYSAVTGAGSVFAARMTIEDFGGSVLDRPLELIVADHQNKANVGAGIAREWADQADFRLVIDMLTPAWLWPSNRSSERRTRLRSTPLSVRHCSPARTARRMGSRGFTTPMHFAIPSGGSSVCSAPESSRWIA